MPNGGTNSTNRGSHPYQAVGKLAPGVDLATAQTRLRTIGDRLARDYPENRFKNFGVTPLQERLTGNVHATLWVLMGAVMLVLLIACANIANLLLARSAARGRIALRTALGAAGARRRQLLTRISTLWFVGGWYLLARGLLKALVALSPANLPRVEVEIDGPVPCFLSAWLLVTLLCGLVPAMHASRPIARRAEARRLEELCQRRLVSISWSS
jgi:hypothetical protein